MHVLGGEIACNVEVAHLRCAPFTKLYLPQAGHVPGRMRQLTVELNRC
jgi:hypothetical protein